MLHIVFGTDIMCFLYFAEIARSFAKGVHFNTFGGNPLCCAVASSVLDVSADHFTFQSCTGISWYQRIAKINNKYLKMNAVCCSQTIKEDKMQENSADVGTYLLTELAKLRDKYEIIGDVRGKGLQIGVEMVKDKVND